MAGRGGSASSPRQGLARAVASLGRAALLLSAALVALPLGADPATAEPACTEVTVVVDPPRHGPSVSCVDAGTATAAALFEETGRELTRVQRFPGAVCRVDGVPAGQACVAMPPADAYWGFFVGEGSTWEYSSLGVDAVTPEAGQSIALVWQDTAQHEEPAVAPGAADRESATAEAAGDATTESDTAASVPTVVAVLLVVGLGAAAVVAARRRR